jgi:predicted 3-demethylubiquinone-9 3-methyltransferase (glyoxalase superfamily)
MSISISPCIWYLDSAIQAFQLYTTCVPNSKLINSSNIVVQAKIAGVDVMGINGGSHFSPNASVSYMLVLEKQAEVDEIWDLLQVEGKILMPLSSYPWSAYYGWVEDKYGVHWQLYLGQLSDVNHQALVPTLMFSGSNRGNCKNAISFYQAVFSEFKLQGILHYSQENLSDYVQHAQFVINGFTIMVMDSENDIDAPFTEGNSFVIQCDTQDEIDFYWNELTKNGVESQCGWCKDPFGVSWQIIPRNMNELIRTETAVAAMMQMKKIDIAKLQNAGV